MKKIKISRKTVPFATMESPKLRTGEKLCCSPQKWGLIIFSRGNLSNFTAHLVIFARFSWPNLWQTKYLNPFGPIFSVPKFSVSNFRPTKILDAKVYSKISWKMYFYLDVCYLYYVSPRWFEQVLDTASFNHNIWKAVEPTRLLPRP